MCVCVYSINLHGLFLLPNRCAFVSNLRKGAAVPSLVPTEKSMKALLNKDLVMNVYRDGLWGVFRHQLLTQGEIESHVRLRVTYDPSSVK